MRAILVSDVINAVCRAAGIERSGLLYDLPKLARGHDKDYGVVLTAIAIIARRRTVASHQDIAAALGLTAHASIWRRVSIGSDAYEAKTTALGWALGYLVPRANAILDEEFQWTTKLAGRVETPSRATVSGAPTVRPSCGTVPYLPLNVSLNRVVAGPRRFKTTL